MKKYFLSLTLLFLSFNIVLTECKVQTNADQEELSLPANDAVPVFNKIVVVIGENTGAASVIGNTQYAPYMNSLMKSGANFTQSYALTHPSQPNYLDLFSGQEQSIADNNKPSDHFTTPNLARELLNAGKTFITYAEDLPVAGYDGITSGLYARKHNPVTNWMGKGKNQVPDSICQPFTAFPSEFSSLPDVSFIIPNLCNDGHSVCAPYNNQLKQFDQWLQDNLDAYKTWSINNNSLLIITYDEDDNTENNRIPAIFYGSHIIKGDYEQNITLHNILRTIEDGMGLTVHAGLAAKSKPITYCWSPVFAFVSKASVPSGSSK